MGLYVQHVHIQWGKKEKGGIGDAARKSIPKVYPVIKMPSPDAYHAWSANFFRRYADQDGHGISMQEKAYEAVPGVLIRLKDGVLHLLPEWDATQVLWFDPDKQPIEEKVNLQGGCWVQLSYQAWGIHRQFYALHVYNIFMGYPEQMSPDIFLQQAPDARLQKGTYYSMYLL